jgi:peptidoglycan-N-acetylglucosamine deacetylase
LILTFDDGPERWWTARVLDELDRCGVRATFFLVGERVLDAPELAREAVERGHDVQLHCHRHIRHSELTERELERDTECALRVLARVGVHPTCWRTPWGEVGAATRRVAAMHGLQLVGWTIDTHDWRGDSTRAMLERAGVELREAAAIDGATELVVLMHDGLGPGARRRGCHETVKLIAPLIGQARACDLRIAALPRVGMACRAGDPHSRVDTAGGAGDPRSRVGVACEPLRVGDPSVGGPPQRAVLPAGTL